MKAATTLVLLAALAGTAHAEFVDGNKLLQLLQGEDRKNSDGIADFLQGLGYITGVADTMRGVVHCPPNNITAGQLTDMVKQVLISQPENRHLTGDRIVGYTLRRAWPCPERKGGGV